MKPRKPITTASLLALVAVLWSGVISTPQASAAVPQYTIMQIQGTGSRSPVEGQTVMTTGVVYDIASNGFWMQDPNGDGDAATSDGIFVVMSSPTVHKGDFISLTGSVLEAANGNDPAAAPETQITGPTISVISTGNALPTPVTIGATNINPAGSYNQLERYEGMRVHVDSLNVIAPTGGALNEAAATSTSDGAFYGVIPNLPRPFRGAGIEQPSTAPSGSPCCIPFWNGAPQRIRVDTATLSTTLNVGTGAVVSDLTGPLSFGQHTYTIVTEVTPTMVTGSGNAAAVPAPTSTEFTIATLNLQRFFNTTDDPGNDVQLTSAAYNGRLNKASLTIRNLLLNPDVIAVQDAENLSTLQALANKVNNDAVAAGKPNPGYAAYLIPGNDVLNQGFLIRPRIAVNSVNQYGKNDMFEQPNGVQAILYDRPPLVLDATVTNQFGTTRFFVVDVQHVGTSGIDNFVDGSRVRLKRRLQAEYLANLVQSFQIANPQAKILIAGGLNAFAVNDGYVDVLGTVVGSPTPANQVVSASNDLVDPNFANLETSLPAEQRYSALDKGTAESLDYLLASNGMMSIFSRLAYTHANADFPEIYRNDFTRPERLSTRDMAVGYFNLPLDHTPPVLTLPGNLTVEATSANGSVVTFTASAVDDFDGVVNVQCTPGSGSTFALGTTSVTCSAQDTQKNKATGTFTVTISDTTGPALTLSTDVTLEATSPAGTVTNFTSTALDSVDGTVAVSCSPASGSTFPLGTTTVACSSEDTRHNVSTGQFHVTVTDTTGPVLTLPADISQGATSASGAVVTYSASATDVVDGTVSVLCNPASGATFALGTTTVSCTTQDAHHNVSNGSFHVNVADSTAPVLMLPANITVSATSASGNTVAFNASATDAVDGPVAITCSPASGTTFPIGTTTVSCTSQDAGHNISTGSFTVRVTDTTPPVLTLPSDLAVNATSSAGAAVTFSASAVDDIDGPVAPTCSASSGSTFAIGTTTVSCTAQDSQHNISSGQFHVTVNDSTPPVLTLPADILVTATSTAGTLVTYSVTAIDAIEGAVSVTCSPASGSKFPLGTSTVSCSAQDSNHNAATGSFHVTVTDTTPPVLTLPADMSVAATSAAGAVVTYSASATDNVDGAIAAVCAPASGTTFPVGTTTVSCSVQDARHNVTNGIFRVTVTAFTSAQPPIVKVTGVVDGGQYWLGAVPNAGCSTQANGIPIALRAMLSVTGGTSNGVGTFVATCSGARDVAGNTAPPVKATFTVKYVWSGFVFLARNRFIHQADSTIPLKWTLMNSRTKLAGDVSSVKSLTFASNSNCRGTPEGSTLPITLGNQGISYVHGVFSANWKTAGVPSGCYSILLGLDDGTTRTAIVYVKGKRQGDLEGLLRGCLRDRFDGNESEDQVGQCIWFAVNRDKEQKRH